MPDDTTIKRVKYFDRQFLRKEEFETDQNYYCRLRWEHNKRMHTAEVIVDGFEVRYKNTTEVSISGGMAIDSKGREILLFEPRALTVVDENEETNKDVYIYLCYSERESDRSSDPGVEGEPTRWVEEPEFRVLPLGTDTQDDLLLAKVTIKKGAVKKIEDMRTLISSCIPNESIDTVHIRNRAVTSEKLSINADGKEAAVATENIRDGAVTSDKLSQDPTEKEKQAVGTDHIQQGAVTTDKIDDNAVTSAKLAINAVEADHIHQGAVQCRHILDNCIDSEKLDIDSVKTDHIQNKAITSDKLSIKDSRNEAAVATNNIQNNAVTSEKLSIKADGKQAAVATENIQNRAVTSEKLSIDAPAVDTNNIRDYAVNHNKLHPGIRKALLNRYISFAGNGTVLNSFNISVTKERRGVYKITAGADLFTKGPVVCWSYSGCRIECIRNSEDTFIHVIDKNGNTYDDSMICIMGIGVDEGQEPSGTTTPIGSTTEPPPITPGTTPPIGSTTEPPPITPGTTPPIGSTTEPPPIPGTK